MCIETYELRFKIFNIQAIKNEILNYFGTENYCFSKYFIKDIYINNNYKHLENIRLRIQNNKKYLIYKKNKYSYISIKDVFYILELENFFFLKKDIFFIAEKNRIEYNFINFKILIDTNIKIKINNDVMYYENIIEFEYYKYENKDRIEKIIKFFEKKELISSINIKSTYQRILDETS
jgi:hypothetical protein